MFPGTVLFSVASCNSQDYAGDILTPSHALVIFNFKVKLKVTFRPWSVNQSLRVGHTSGSHDQTIVGLLMCGAISDERTGLKFTVTADVRQCSLSEFRGTQSIVCCLRFEAPPTWKARSPHLYPQGIGRSSYILRFCDPFSSLLTAHKATIQMFDLQPHPPSYVASTRTAQKKRVAYQSRNSSFMVACAFVAAERFLSFKIYSRHVTIQGLYGL
jgi:hypothetical protein